MPSQDSISKAQYFTFKIGVLSVEGIQMPDKSLGMTVTQFCLLVLPDSVRLGNTTRDFKRLLSKDSRIVQIRVNRPIQNRPERIATVPQVTQALRKLDRKGNQLAQDLVDAMAGLALTELMNDGLGVESDNLTRENYIIERQLHRKSFQPHFTDHIKEQDLPRTYPVYVMQMKRAVGLPDDLSVDEMTKAQIEVLNSGYRDYHAMYAMAGMEHDEIIEAIAKNRAVA